MTPTGMRLSDGSQSQKDTQCILTFIYYPWNSIITEVGTDNWLPGLRDWGQETGVAVQGEARGSLGVIRQLCHLIVAAVPRIYM